MFQRFFPNEYYDSTYHIDFQAFYDKGYRAVLFDVDNTLVEHDAPANARTLRSRCKENNKCKDTCG